MRAYAIGDVRVIIEVKMNGLYSKNEKELEKCFSSFDQVGIDHLYITVEESRYMFRKTRRVVAKASHFLAYMRRQNLVSGCGS